MKYLSVLALWKGKVDYKFNNSDKTSETKIKNVVVKNTLTQSGTTKLQNTINKNQLNGFVDTQLSDLNRE